MVDRSMVDLPGERAQQARRDVDLDERRGDERRRSSARRSVPAARSRR
jgi:hypothetical protein